CTPAAFELFEGTGVELLKELSDRGVELAEREERAVAKARQDPAFDDEHAGLDLGLVAGLADAGGQNGDVVVLGEVLVARINRRLIAVSALDGAAKVVYDNGRRQAAEVIERSHVSADPIGQLLTERRLGVGVVRAAEHGDENLRLLRLAGIAVDDRDG